MLTTSRRPISMNAPSPSPSAAPSQPSSIAESYYRPYGVPCASYAALPLSATSNVEENQGNTPAATLAPNYVFQTMAADGTATQCFTETLGAGSIMNPACSGANSIVACSQNTGGCADALARGLLSRLNPILSGTNDSVFTYTY